MTDQKDKAAAKSVKEMTAYERWELPSLSDGGPAAQSMRRTETVKPLTADDLEQIRKEAYQDGLKQGKADGFNQGVVEGRKKGLQEGKQEGLKLGQEQARLELQSNQKSLEQLFTNLLQPIEEQKEAVEQVLLNTVLALVRSVIHLETTMNSDVIKQALTRSIDSLPKHAQDITIQLNPQDKTYVVDLIQTLSPEATVRPNAAIARGGCIIETTDQVLDYTVEKRYQLAVQSMLMDAAKAQNFEVHQETPDSMQTHTDYSSALLSEGQQLAEQEQVQGNIPNDSESNVHATSDQVDGEEKRSMEQESPSDSSSDETEIEPGPEHE
ncbi:hypothetical protein A3765_02540 [Oleiphilus sp. HI0130]|uniref:flagellar assembly protein FliH n=2 Tax=Oleiphilus sp. HI0079 TaxID=1822254 RepID=UPI0007C38AEC|nr:flagellar assembly protein FliH [Oleiphilus sp. HI0079]KZZ12728.1 hypothetical protein A3750_05045 [Oleiphilus sp. HI0079]KZZ70924.1 hypothetical protein A3765_02540 [Oleiphilus sp. HI0130]